ncbi:MAG: alpha/beta fold hydrolase [Flavobacteriales bacterium]|nr:alpha/beta fold hydrolase [Flavobacteriales bacterium]
MHWLVGVIVVVVLAYAGVCLFYYLFQERFIFIRFKLRKSYRFRFSRPFSEHWIVRPDGARLHALWFKASSSRQVVLYFHGNTGSLRRWGRYASQLIDLGVDVVMPDPRGYGKSRGKLSEVQLIEDAKAWFDHVQELTGTAPVVYGRSLGSGLAVPVAVDRNPPLLILETPFANLIDVAHAYLPILPYRWLLHYRFQNDEMATRLACPTYLFHGKRDQTVPYSSALKLYAALPSTIQRELITIPDGGHSDLHLSQEFRTRMAELLGAADQ